MAGSRTVTVETGYEPRKLQRVLHLLMQAARFIVLVCHRRFGKTVCVINHMIAMGMRCPLKNPQYAYFAPTYGQAKRVSWDYFKEFTKDIPGRSVNESELRIDIARPHLGDRIRFYLLGAENPDSHRGMYFDGVCVDEFAQCPPHIWGEVIRPALSDRKGWCIFIGTPKGRNHFYEMYHTALDLMAKGDAEWMAKMYRASETGVIDPGELNGAKITMSEEEYEQEYECSFSAAMIGAYYAKHMNALEKEGQVCAVPYDLSVPVSTYWDLGISDSTCIWFVQQVGHEIHVVDYVEAHGKGLEYYVNLIFEKRKENRIQYSEHVLPHDARAKELGTGKSREEFLRSIGLEGVRVLARESLMDGIHAVRLLLPRCWFDKELTKNGMEGLRSYERSFDAKLQVFKDKPLHNWASHSADGFRTLAMGLRAPMERRSKYMDRSTRRSSSLRLLEF